MELRTLARMAYDMTWAFTILTAGMLRDAVTVRLNRAVHRRCCGLWTEDGMW